MVGDENEKIEDGRRFQRGGAEDVDCGVALRAPRNDHSVERGSPRTVCLTCCERDPMDRLCSLSGLL